MHTVALTTALFSGFHGYGGHCVDCTGGIVVDGHIMLLECGGRRFEVELYDNAAVADLTAGLPQTVHLSRWGDEYYGTLSGKISTVEPLRDVFEVGEVALWPSGNALCIFFGPTPASRGSEPRMASPGVPLGKIAGDALVLRAFGPSLKASLSLKE
jgi:hypothetical protein